MKKENFTRFSVVALLLMVNNLTASYIEPTGGRVLLGDLNGGASSGDYYDRTISSGYFSSINIDDNNLTSTQKGTSSIYDVNMSLDFSNMSVGDTINTAVAFKVEDSITKSATTDSTYSGVYKTLAFAIDEVNITKSASGVTATVPANAHLYLYGVGSSNVYATRITNGSSNSKLVSASETSLEINLYNTISKFFTAATSGGNIEKIWNALTNYTGAYRVYYAFDNYTGDSGDIQGSSYFSTIDNFKTYPISDSSRTSFSFTGMTDQTLFSTPLGFGGCINLGDSYANKCLTGVTSLSASASYTSASASWVTDGSTSYKVYLYKGDSLVSGYPVEVSNNNYSLNSLSKGTTYTVKVNSMHNGVEYSGVVASYSFTTGNTVVSETGVSTGTSGSVTGSNNIDLNTDPDIFVVESDVIDLGGGVEAKVVSTTNENTATTTLSFVFTNAAEGTTTSYDVAMSSDAVVEMKSGGGFKATEKTKTGNDNTVDMNSNGTGNMQSVDSKSNFNSEVPNNVKDLKVSTDKVTGNLNAIMKIIDNSKQDVPISLVMNAASKAFEISFIPPNGLFAGKNIKSNAASGADYTEVKYLESSANKKREVEKVYKGVLITFKSSRSFFAVKKSNSRATDYSEYKSVEIIPTTQWQKFEETITFDGKRSIKLVMGGANIIIDGEESVMEKDIEYLIPIEAVESNINNSESIFNNGKLSISKNWNLLALPVDETMNTSEVEDISEAIWTYENLKWIKNPKTLTKKEGFWLKSNSDTELDFNGSSYEPSVTDLSLGWHLIGTGSDLSNFKSNNKLNLLWTFQNGKWAENPQTIYRGQGFWIKK